MRNLSLNKVAVPWNRSSKKISEEAEWKRKRELRVRRTSRRRRGRGRGSGSPIAAIAEALCKVFYTTTGINGVEGGGRLGLPLLCK